MLTKQHSTAAQQHSSTAQQHSTAAQHSSTAQQHSTAAQRKRKAAFDKAASCAMLAYKHKRKAITQAQQNGAALCTITLLQLWALAF
jgi:hypothetical protein